MNPLQINNNETDTDLIITLGEDEELFNSSISFDNNDPINTPALPEILVDDFQVITNNEGINAEHENSIQEIHEIIDQVHTIQNNNPIQEIHEIIDQVHTIQNDVSQLQSMISPVISVASTIGQTLGSIALFAASSNLGRKAAFTGLMYFAGGTIVSTIGFVPTVIAGGVIMLAT
jgi:hypothetical protein